MPSDTSYVLEGAKWGDPTPGTPSGIITYSFATGDLGGEPFHIDGGLDPSFRADFAAALGAWSAAAGVRFQEVPDSTASDIRVGWEHIDGPYDVVAQTWYSWAGGAMLRNWIGFDDSESYAATPAGHVLGDGITFGAIATHEIGHALGLGHDNAEPAIMNAVMSVNQLQPPDIAGVQALYGMAATSPLAPAADAGSFAAATDRLVALPPPSDASFGKALLADIADLVAQHGLPAGADAAPLQHLAAELESWWSGDRPDAAAAGLLQDMPHPLQQDVLQLLGQAAHADWFHQG